MQSSPKNSPCKEQALDLLHDAAAHIRGYYEEPFYARFLRAAYSIQGAETLMNAAGEQDKNETVLSRNALSRFISLYATLKGGSFSEEKTLIRENPLSKAA
ncbi:MAG: hypothetical protein AABX47_08710 [Nanoarchaeota archaeon]